MSDSRVYLAGSVHCPECGSASRTRDSRPTAGSSATRRRRECPHGHRFTTMETVVGATPTQAMMATCPLRSEPFREALKALLAEDAL